MKILYGNSRIKKSFLAALILFCSASFIQAQNSYSFASMSESPAVGSGTNWLLGARIGLSIASGGGSSSLGFQIGPLGEVLIGKSFAVGTELNINTQAGTPIEWATYAKYYFYIPNSDIKPYADLGPSLWFATDGPYFGIRFGGGANFKVAKNLYIPADIQLGPVFVSQKTQEYDWYTGRITSTSKTNTIFYVAITTGIRYELP